MSTSTPAKPSFSNAELKHRESQLLRCFTCINSSNTGNVTTNELEYVAKLFNPNANDFGMCDRYVYTVVHIFIYMFSLRS